MGQGTRQPTSNDPPRRSEGKSKYLQENDIWDETALLLNDFAKRCIKCGLAVRVKYLKDGVCPDCRGENVKVRTRSAPTEYYDSDAD